MKENHERFFNDHDCDCFFSVDDGFCLFM